MIIHLRLIRCRRAIAVFQCISNCLQEREGERKERKNKEEGKIQEQPPSAPTASTVSAFPIVINPGTEITRPTTQRVSDGVCYISIIHVI